MRRSGSPRSPTSGEPGEFRSEEVVERLSNGCRTVAAGIESRPTSTNMGRCWPTLGQLVRLGPDLCFQRRRPFVEAAARLLGFCSGAAGMLCVCPPRRPAHHEGEADGVSLRSMVLRGGDGARWPLVGLCLGIPGVALRRPCGCPSISSGRAEDRSAGGSAEFGRPGLGFGRCPVLSGRSWPRNRLWRPWPCLADLFSRQPAPRQHRRRKETRGTVQIRALSAQIRGKSQRAEHRPSHGRSPLPISCGYPLESQPPRPRDCSAFRVQDTGCYFRAVPDLRCRGSGECRLGPSPAKAVGGSATFLHRDFGPTSGTT